MINQHILYSHDLVDAESTEKSTVLDDFLNDALNLECFSIVNGKDDLECLESQRLQKWLSLNEFVIFGTGGSSLGGRCVHAISDNCQKKIKFVSNLDPRSLKEVLSEINVAETGFLCISKSGETLETIVQLLLAMELVGGDMADRFVVVTEDRRSTMVDVANEFGFLRLDHPKNIGGRFSVFSIVGMLPAIMSGIDPIKIRSGGKFVLENMLDSVKKGARFVYGNLKRGISQHASFVYSDRLAPFAEWLAQLYAESSGKQGEGITPLTARGSIDQHSQLQLYMDGRDDKCFSFFLEKQDSDTTIASAPEKFFYLENKRISDIFEAQCKATSISIAEKGRDVRIIETQSISPEILGALFMHFMLEVVLLCRLINVNPFDQPAVERCKEITKRLLGGQ
jgi:glucose-6-phosphate isomerase